MSGDDGGGVIIAVDVCGLECVMKVIYIVVAAVVVRLLMVIDIGWC